MKLIQKKLNLFIVQNVGVSEVLLSGQFMRETAHNTQNTHTNIENKVLISIYTNEMNNNNNEIKIQINSNNALLLTDLINLFNKILTNK